MNSAMRRCQLLLLWFSGTVVGVGQALRLVPLMGDGSGVLIAEVNGTEGGVCPDGFTLREATVACRQLGLGWGRYLRPIEFDPELIASQRHAVRVGRCYGNESRLNQCRFHSASHGVPCQSQKTMGVRCTESLPDLEPNVGLTETSSYVATSPIFSLLCAMEENCLGPSASVALREKSPTALAYHTRVLLRFSSVILNKGTAPFLPLLDKEEWTFHRCHRHYHSMPDFARYAVLDRNGTKISAGHKSSFCLEDSNCQYGIKKYFLCSRVPKKYGTQGISPGCQDTYFHDYDCQWVDITDIGYGRYIFQMAVNPNYAVAESNYFNNGIECDFYHYEPESFLRQCRAKHPMDLML